MSAHVINIGEPWMWGAFIVFVLAMLALDLFVFGGARRIGCQCAKPCPGSLPGACWR